MGRVATLHPPLSPMLWTSIATGKRPFKHGIHGFTEPTPDGQGVRPITNLSRKSKAVWNILNQNGLRTTVIGWWPSHPAEPVHGVMVSDHYHKAKRDIEHGWPLLANAVYPPDLHDTLADLRLHPQELVGPMLAPFIPHLNKVDQEKDRRFSMLASTLAECVSIHSAATWLIENQPWDFFAVYYDAIDHFCHGFMKYHPPRQPWISEADFELYSSVVSTAYVLHDQMLGTLLAKAGDETNVILMSDHGFHPDHLRPRGIPDFPAGPAVEHSPYGIFVMAGPGIRKDEPLFGVNLLDLAPPCSLFTAFPRVKIWMAALSPKPSKCLPPRAPFPRGKTFRPSPAVPMAATLRTRVSIPSPPPKPWSSSSPSATWKSPARTLRNTSSSPSASFGSIFWSPARTPTATPKPSKSPANSAAAIPMTNASRSSAFSPARPSASPPKCARSSTIWTVAAAPYSKPRSPA